MKAGQWEGEKYIQLEGKMADIIEGKEYYDQPVPEKPPEQPMTYITNMPGALPEFKEDSQLRMPDISAPNNDRFIYIPQNPQDTEKVSRDWRGQNVEVLEMPFDVPARPSDDDLQLFEKRENFKKVLAERSGIDPDAVFKNAEADYLKRFPVEQRTPAVYTKALQHAAAAKIAASKELEPYLKMFDEKVKGVDKNQTFEQLTARALKGDPEAKMVLAEMEKRQIRIAQAGQGGFGTIPEDSKNIFYEQYYRTKQLPPFATRDAQSRNSFIEGFANWAKSSGIEGADVIAQRAESDALTKSIANQEKVRGMMGGFVRNLNKQVDRVGQIGNDLVSRVGVRVLDLPIRELLTRFVGSGQEQVLESYLAEISNEIGKLSTGSSASVAELSTEAQKRWNKIHDPNLSMKELKKILDETQHQANMRITSSEEELKSTKQRLSGKGSQQGAQQGAQQGTTQGRDFTPLVGWIKQNSGFDSKQLYYHAISAGWQPEEIKSAWRLYRGK